MKYIKSFEKLETTIEYKNFNIGDIVYYVDRWLNKISKDSYTIVGVQYVSKKVKKVKKVLAQNNRTGLYKSSIFEDTPKYNKFNWIDSDLFKTELELKMDKYNL